MRPPLCRQNSQNSQNRSTAPMSPTSLPHVILPAGAQAAGGQGAAVSDGRRALYETLVTRHAALLERVSRRLCRDGAAADDIVQDTYVEAWRSIDSLRDTANARPWLLAILRHRFARWARTAARTPSPSADAATF